MLPKTNNSVSTDLTKLLLVYQILDQEVAAAPWNFCW